MKVIWKFSIGYEITELLLPEDAQVLTVQIQSDVPQIWVLLDKKAPAVVRRFRLYPTGLEADFENNKYIGTFQHSWLVFHLFEIIREDR